MMHNPAGDAALLYIGTTEVTKGIGARFGFAPRSSAQSPSIEGPFLHWDQGPMADRPVFGHESGVMAKVQAKKLKAFLVECALLAATVLASPAKAVVADKGMYSAGCTGLCGGSQQENRPIAARSWTWSEGIETRLGSRAGRLFLPRRFLPRRPRSVLLIC